MKKYLALLMPVAYFSLASSALAVDVVNGNVSTCVGGQFNILCQLQAGNLGGIIGSLIQLIFAIAVIVALLYLIYGGFRWLVSSGDKSQVSSAREHIVAAIIGLVIIFLSYFILNLILQFFNVGTLSSIHIPQINLTPGT
jgi:hypothetical protein